MVFKVKQRAEKDYDSYRTRQVLKAVSSKLAGNQKIVDTQDATTKYAELTKNKRIGEVYGDNWPYDFFSFVETLKIDINFEML